MSYQVDYNRTAEKQLRDLHPTDARRVKTAVNALKANPRPDGVTKLTGPKDYYRIRVGKCRVVYEIHDDEVLIVVIKVGVRGDVYQGL